MKYKEKKNILYFFLLKQPSHVRLSVNSCRSNRRKTCLTPVFNLFIFIIFNKFYYLLQHLYKNKKKHRKHNLIKFPHNIKYYSLFSKFSAFLSDLLLRTVVLNYDTSNCIVSEPYKSRN